MNERNISAAITNWEFFYGEEDAIQDGRDRRVTFREEPEVREVTTEYQFYRMEENRSRSKMLFFRR